MAERRRKFDQDFADARCRWCRRPASRQRRWPGRAAYPSNGPGAAGHGRRRVINTLGDLTPLLPGIPQTRSGVGKLPLALAALHQDSINLPPGG